MLTLLWPSVFLKSDSSKKNLTINTDSPKTTVYKAATMKITSYRLCVLFCIHISNSVVNRNCFTSDCRSSSCCSETQCLQNPLVHYGNSHQCPCMIPQNIMRVTAGSSILLECNPGGSVLSTVSGQPQYDPVSPKMPYGGVTTSPSGSYSSVTISYSFAP